MSNNLIKIANTPVHEYYSRTGASYNGKINDPDAYKFANGILLDMCMKYIPYAFHCKAKVSPVKSRNDNGLHRAAFNVTLTSLNFEAASDKHRVLCKIFNKEKENNCVAIDYNAIVDGYYDFFATVIEGTVYYLHLSDVYQYQQEMGNACISPSRKYINVDVDFIINYARNSLDMYPEDIDIYNKEYDRLIRKAKTGNYVGESLKNKKGVKALLEGIRSVTGIKSKFFDKAVLRIINENLNQAEDIAEMIRQFVNENDPEDYAGLCDFVAFYLDLRHIIEFFTQKFNSDEITITEIVLLPENDDIREWIIDVCSTGFYENELHTYDGYPDQRLIKKELFELLPFFKKYGSVYTRDDWSAFF